MPKLAVAPAMPLPFSSASAARDERPAALTAADVMRLGQRLPAAHQVFNRISRLLGDANSSLDEIVKLVRLDAALALRVLQLSNGAYYGFRERCGSLDEAVNRLGFREAHRLVGVIAAQHLFCTELAVYRIPAQLAWENSVAGALALEWLARQQGKDRDDAYAAGLLRSVGKIVLNRILIERPTVVCAYPGEEAEPDAHRWERRVFGVSAAEAAAILMEDWRFPRVLCEAVRRHLEPPLEPEAPVEACLLNLAGWVAARLGSGLPGEAACCRLTPEKLQRADLTELELEECARHTEAALRHLRSACR